MTVLLSIVAVFLFIAFIRKLIRFAFKMVALLMLFMALKTAFFTALAFTPFFN